MNRVGLLVPCAWGKDKTTQRRATYACAKQGGDGGGDATRAETRGVSPQPWAGRRPLVQAKPGAHS